MDHIPEHVKQMIRDTQRERTREIDQVGRRTARDITHYLFRCPLCNCEIKSRESYKGNVNVINHVKSIKHQKLCGQRDRDLENRRLQAQAQNQNLPQRADLLILRGKRMSYWFDRPNPEEPNAPPVDNDYEPPRRLRRLNNPNQGQQPQDRFIARARPERNVAVAEGGADGDAVVQNENRNRRNEDVNEDDAEDDIDEDDDDEEDIDEDNDDEDGAQHENQNRDDDVDGDDDDNQEDLDEDDDVDDEEDNAP